MKKISLMLLAACAFGFTACENYEEALPQSNPQEAILSVDGIAVTPAVGDSVVLSEDAASIAVLNIDKLENFPASSELQLVMQLSKSEDFSTYKEVETTISDNTVSVDVLNWQAAHLQEFGKSPKAKQAYIRYAAYAVNGTSTVRIGNPEYYIGQSTTIVTPIASDIVIEEAYYLLGTINGWDVATAVKFNHSDVNVYDDPIFTLSVEITPEEATAGWWWKIVPQSTYETGNWVDAANASYGVAENGSTEMEGMLVARTATEDCGAGCIVEAGIWLISIDMENGTYAFTSANPYLYTPGDSNGWNHGSSQLLWTENYSDYKGYAYLTTGGFKFTDAPDWNHGNYGAGASEGTLVNGSNDNLPVAENGLYWIEVNIPSLTYKTTQVTTYGLIGDATPGGWDASTALTPSEDFLFWFGTVELKGTGELKFRANDAWDINLGGTIENLVPNGANIPTPGEGTYEVSLDLSTIPYTAWFEKIN